MNATVGGIISALGQTVQGYGVDKERRIKDALASRKQEQDEKRDSVLNALGVAQTNAIEHPAPKAPPQTVAAGAGVLQPDGSYKVPVPVTPKEPTSHFSFPVGAVNGQPTVFKGNTLTGELTPGVDAKADAGAAKLTEPQEKSYLFYNLMKNSEPEITATLATGKVRPAAITAYLNSGPVDALAYAALNDEEQKLIRGMRDFSAGVLRKESGAAITHDELRDTFGRYFPAFGEDSGPGTVGESKANARRSYLHTMEQEAGPATEFYGKKKPTATAVDHTKLSDEEFARRYRAGEFRTP